MNARVGPWPRSELSEERQGEGIGVGYLRFSRKAFWRGMSLSSEKQSCLQAVEGETGEHCWHAGNASGRSLEVKGVSENPII